MKIRPRPDTVVGFAEDAGPLPFSGDPASERDRERERLQSAWLESEAWRAKVPRKLLRILQVTGE